MWEEDPSLKFCMTFCLTVTEQGCLQGTESVDSPLSTIGPISSLICAEKFYLLGLVWTQVIPSLEVTFNGMEVDA